MNEVWLVGTITALLAPLLVVVAAVRLGGDAVRWTLPGTLLLFMGPGLALEAADRWDLTGSLGWAGGVALGLALAGLGSGLVAWAADDGRRRLVRRFVLPLLGLWVAQLVCLAAYLGILRALSPATAEAWGVWPTVAYALATFVAMPLFAWSGLGGAALALWAAGPGAGGAGGGRDGA